MKKICCLTLLAWLGQLHAQETFTFGATTNVPGGALAFENAATYVTNGGFCFSTWPGTPADSSAGGYYTDTQIFSALPVTDPDAAAPGTVIQVKLLKVEGPPGASLGFWEGDGGADGTNLTWSVPVPSANNTNLIRVTEATATATNDPYGDVLGRVLTFSQPGLYKITWQLVDTSTNGPGGTPLDSPSAPFTIYYQADITIGDFAVDAAGIHITFAALNPFADYELFQTPSLGADANWLPLDADGNNLPGDGRVRTITLPPPPADTSEFYRIILQSAGGS